MPKESLDGARLDVKVNSRLDVKKLQKFLNQNGYSRSETVREAGEYAIRGGIIDLYPPGYAEPVRVDLFGEDVESIRSFDPVSQLTQSKLNGFTLQPVTEFFLNEESINRFRAGYREAFGAARADDPLYEAVSEGRRYNGMDHWLPLFHEKLETLFDYAPNAAVTMDYHAAESHDERLTQIKDFYDARETLRKAAVKKQKKAEDVSLSGAVYNPLPVEKLYIAQSEWSRVIKDAQSLSPFASPHPSSPLEEGRGVGGGYDARKGRDFADIRALPDGDVFAELRKHIVFLQSPSSPEESLSRLPLPPGEGGGEGSNWWCGLKS
jgi:transcription-repair coupling factor (superfamily II helicase)